MNQTIKWLGMIMVLFLSVGTLRLNAETLKIYATKDSYTWDYDPAANMGGMVTASITRDSSHQNITYLYFPISTLPANAIVDDAVVKLYVGLFMGEFTTSTKYVSLEISSLSSYWGETSITWNNSPSIYAYERGETWYQNGQEYPNKYFAFDAKNLVDAWRNYGNYGARVAMGSSGITSGQLLIYTHEYTGTTCDPYLEIQYHLPSTDADLEMSNLSATRPSDASSRIFSSCSFTIANNGPLDLVSEFIIIDYYLSNDTTFGDSDDVGIGDTGHTISLSSGYSTTLTLNSSGLSNMVDLWTEGLVAGGSYYLYAKVRVNDGSPSDPTSNNNYNRWGSFSYAPTAVLTVVANPSNGGVVSGSGSYTVGSSRQISATANSGWTFANWNDGNTSVTRAVTVPSGGVTYTANFTPVYYTITTVSSPSAGGITSGGGSKQSGSSCTVTASVASGYTFSNWTEGGTVVSASANYTFTVTGTRTLTANFTQNPVYYTITTVSNPSAGGTTSGGGSKQSGSSCTVTASAASGYTFSNWTEGGTVVSSSASYTFTVTGARTLMANFTLSGDGIVVRLISGTAATINIVSDAGVSAWGVEESLPAGLTPSDLIGPNANWNSTSRKITWYGTGDSEVTLGYTVAGNEGSYTVSGVANFDGTDISITGDDEFTIANCHPADLNSDWQMAMGEAITYLAGWQQGVNTMSYAIRSAYLWQKGPGYTRLTGTAEPLCWEVTTVSYSLAGTVLSTMSIGVLTAGGGTADRTVTGSSVSIAITPPAGTFAWGYEETVPAGLTPSGLTGPNANWNATSRKITWYATGDTSAALGYTVSGSDGTYDLVGVVNFDGTDVTVSGDSQVVIGTPVTPVLSVTPSDHTVTKDMGTVTFNVANTGTGTMPWTAEVTSGGTWARITSGSSGSNAGTVTVSYDANPSGGAQRTATIRVTATGATGSPVDVTVVQAANPVTGNGVTIDGNSMWNSHAYFSWQNITHVNLSGSDNAVIDTWKVDDNGNGDPRDDESRILLNGRTDGAFGIYLGCANSISGQEPGWTAQASLDAKGNGVVTFTRSTATGNATATYTLTPESGDLYGKVIFQTAAAGDFYWGVSMINSVWVNTNPGEMALYNQCYLDGTVLDALESARTQDWVLGEDYLQMTDVRQGVAAVLSATKDWKTAFELTDAPEDASLRAEVRMSSEYGGWGFGRSAQVHRDMQAGEQITVCGIFKTDVVSSDERNVALESNGGVASAGTVGTYGETQYACHANDGDPTTAWCNSWAMPDWLKVEFNQTYLIERVGVVWGEGTHNQTFSISVSEDGENWRVVVPSRRSATDAGYTGTDYYGSSKVVCESFPISPTRAQFIKIDVTETSAPGSHIFKAIVHELQAYTADPRNVGWAYPRMNRAGLACTTERTRMEIITTNFVEKFAIDGATENVLAGDVDGDGNKELVVTVGSELRLYAGNGTLKQTVVLPRICHVAMLEDVDGDGVLDIGLGSNGSGFSAYFYKGDGTLLKTFVGQHGGGSDNWMSPIALSGSNVLMGYNAGFAITPRGVAAFDYATASESWYYQIGPACGVYSVADLDGNGLLDITMNAATVHNGASGNGTTDGDIYLIAVNETGSKVLSQIYPSPSNGNAYHRFADLDGDGICEIVGFEEHDSYYTGMSQIHVYGTNGVEQYSFDGSNNSGWTYAIGYVNSNSRLDIVASTILDEKTYLLDNSLNILCQTSGMGCVQALGDLTGDGVSEIVTLSKVGVLRVLDSQLNVLATAQAGNSDGVVALSDIDDDGVVDVICRTDKAYVFSFDIVKPELFVTPTMRSVSKDVSTTTFNIANIGGNTMAWTAEVTDGNTWARITSGTSGNNAGIVMITCDANPAGCVERTAIIRVTSVGAIGSPLEVVVTQAVHPGVFFENTFIVTDGEGNSRDDAVNAVIPVSGTGPASIDVYVLPGSATAADYTAPRDPINLTWADGESGTKNVIIPIKGDTRVEGDEVFFLALGTPSLGELGEQQVCMVTITDDDTGTPRDQGVYVSGVSQPADGGKITGSRYCQSGRFVNLSARANKGWTFLGWEDGSLDARRKVQSDEAESSASNGVMVCTAYFKPDDQIAPPVSSNPGAQSAMVGVYYALPLPVDSECPCKVGVTGLPRGLKYDSSTGAIAGTPTSEGIYNVTLTASNPAGDALPQTFVLTVDPLPDWAQGSFNGWTEFDGEGCGLGAMTVDSSGRISGKIQLSDAQYSFKATGFTGGNVTDGFTLEADVRLGKAGTGKLELTVSKPVITDTTGTVPDSLGVVNGALDDTLNINLYRNVWGDAALPDGVLSDYEGYYTVSLAGDGTFGYGYLSLTVDAKGNVKIGGKLADGTSVTQSGTLVLDEAGAIWIPLFFAPKNYDGGFLFGFAEFVKSGTGDIYIRLFNDSPLLWTSLDPEATGIYGEGFSRLLDISGGMYDKLANLRNYYEHDLIVDYVTLPALSVQVKRKVWSSWWEEYITRTEMQDVNAFYDASPEGLAIEVSENSLSAPASDRPQRQSDGSYDYSADSSGDGVVNSSGFSIRLTKATGVFKGNFKVFYEYAVQTGPTGGDEKYSSKSKRISYEGVLNPMDYEGAGYYLWKDNAEYDSGRVDSLGNPIMKNYKFNASYPFLMYTPD